MKTLISPEATPAPVGRIPRVNFVVIGIGLESFPPLLFALCASD